ncbi:mCG144891, partial [Mus musculus]
IYTHTHSACMYPCAPHACLLSEEIRRSIWSSRTGIMDASELATEPRSSSKATSGLNHQAISPALLQLLDKLFSFVLYWVSLSFLTNFFLK